MSAQGKILVGIIFTVLTLIALIILGVNEEARMTRQQAVFAARNIERGAEYYETYCQLCHGNKGQGVVGFGPPLNRKDLLDTKNAPYLRFIKWGGTLSDFLHDTIAAGRPQPSQFYASQNFVNRMPTWSQDYGGPLRPDQVDSLVAYIQNWAPGEYEPIVALPTATATGAATAAAGATAAATPAATGTAGGATPPFQLPPSPDVIAAGKAIYDQPDKCTVCHGPNGDANTAAAQAFTKKPRNFTNCDEMKQFSMATHYDAVFNGRIPTGMPAWKDKLTTDQIWQVIMYERSFCQAFTP